MIGPMAFMTVPQAVVDAAERFGSRTALVSSNGTESFTELHARVASAATAIRRLARPAEALMITYHLTFNGQTTGAIPAVVNRESTPRELDYLRHDLEPAAVLFEKDLTQLEQGDSGMEPAAADPMETAAIVYTSGTTSRPKGVMVRHAAYTETGRSFPRWIGLGEEERLWACLPLFHINAQAYSLMSSLMCGHSLAISERFHASSFWRDAANLEVTSVNVIGAMLTFLERQPAESWTKSRLHTIYAAPAPEPANRRALEERFAVRITGGYGMSENPFGCAESATSRMKARSIGRPRQPSSRAFENELRIVKPDGSRISRYPQPLGMVQIQRPDDPARDSVGLCEQSKTTIVITGEAAVIKTQPDIAGGIFTICTRRTEGRQSVCFRIHMKRPGGPLPPSDGGSNVRSDADPDIAM